MPRCSKSAFLFLMTVLSQVFRCYDFWLARKTQHLQSKRMKARFSDFVFKAGMGKFVIVPFPRKAPIGPCPFASILNVSLRLWKIIFCIWKYGRKWLLDQEPAVLTHIRHIHQALHDLWKLYPKISLFMCFYFEISDSGFILFPQSNVTWVLEETGFWADLRFLTDSKNRASLSIKIRLKLWWH